MNFFLTAPFPDHCILFTFLSFIRGELFLLFEHILMLMFPNRFRENTFGSYKNRKIANCILSIVLVQCYSSMLTYQSTCYVHCACVSRLFRNCYICFYLCCPFLSIMFEHYQPVFVSAKCCSKLFSPSVAPI